MNVCPIPPTRYNANNVNFSGIKEQNTGGFLPAVSSLILPGLGQYMNNEGSKGAFYMISSVGVTLASTVIAAFSTKALLKHFKTSIEKLPEVFEKYTKSVAKNKKSLPKSVQIAGLATAALGVLSPTLRLVSFIDAYKGKTSADIKKVPVPVPIYVKAAENHECKNAEGCEDC